MQSKLSVLKLLWANLKHLQEKGESPNDTFDFLNENEMVTYLFNEDSKYIELLLLTLEMNSEMLEKLNPNFMKMYQNFFDVKETKETKETKEINETKETKKVMKMKEEPEEIELEDEVEDEEVEENVSEDEEVVSEENNGNVLEKFLKEHVVEDEDEKVSIKLIEKKFKEWQVKNNEETDEDLIEFLKERFGKPKGKSNPKFIGLKLV